VRLISKRRLAAGVAAALAGLCIAGTPTSASASIPVLHAGNGDVAHQCTIIGGPDSFSEQAVVCVTMQTSLSSFGAPVVDAYAQLICELPDGTTRRCLQANVYGALATATAGAGYRYQYSCTGTGCLTGRNTWFIGEMTLSPTNCQSSLSNNAWAVVYGQDALTSIQLASYDPLMYLGPTANDSGNESTGHYQICP
jgi:hypothetical protein